MPSDTFTTYLQIRLPATGAYNNTWGATLNADALSLLDQAITGQVVMNVGASTSYSIAALTPGVQADPRFFSWLLSGAPTGPVTITVPSSVPAKMALVVNELGQPATFTYAGSTSTVTVNAGEYRLIWLDGENCWQVTAGATSSTSLNNVPYNYWMRASRTPTEIAANTIVTNVLSVPTSTPIFGFSDSPTITLNTQNGNNQAVTLTGNRTMATPINPVDGFSLRLVVTQDSTGGRTLTWASSFLFPNGQAPTLASQAGGIDKFDLLYQASSGSWLCSQVPNLSSGSVTIAPLTIAQNTRDFSLLQQLGTISGAVNVTVKVGTGVVIESSSALMPAMDLSGLPSGSTVNLINQGYVQGHGGDGADSGASVGGVSFGYMLLPRNGKAGGLAIKGPGSGVTFNVTNGNGNIWGGGGGGGAGGIQQNSGAGNYVSGAPGGGGAGLGRGGKNFAAGDFNHQTSGSDGADGTAGPNGALGGAGTAGTIGTAYAGTGGAGGTWGTVGTAGSAPSGGSGVSLSPGTGGAAGAAIALNGGTINWISGSASPNVQGVVTP